MMSVGSGGGGGVAAVVVVVVVVVVEVVVSSPFADGSSAPQAARLSSIAAARNRAVSLFMGSLLSCCFFIF
jgi:hypothetical protein